MADWRLRLNYIFIYTQTHILYICFDNINMSEDNQNYSYRSNIKNFKWESKYEYKWNMEGATIDPVWYRSIRRLPSVWHMQISYLDSSASLNTLSFNPSSWEVGKSADVTIAYPNLWLCDGLCDCPGGFACVRVSLYVVFGDMISMGPSCWP